MRTQFHRTCSSVSSTQSAAERKTACGNQQLRVPVLLAGLAVACAAMTAQTANRITQAVDTAQVQALPHHLPQWANAANHTGPAAPGLKLEQMTLVLARSPQQEAALTQLLADQQNPASPSYHHWLTPDEMGLRFGLSDSDIAAITAWLQSQGLHVNWVAPSRIFIGFGGVAADVNRAFQTELHTYTVNGEARYSVNSDPMIPAALAPAIKAIRGLSTPGEKPQHHISVMQSPSPQMTSSSGNHYLAPADFNTIYDVPASYTGAGYTIGIVGWMPVNTSDLDEFRSRTGAIFSNPSVVVPTSYGGITPDAACTSTTCSSTDLSGQGEATLDVLRAGSTAPGANLLLVVSTSSGTNDGIGADAQYLVGTSPLPAQIMTISFGSCETGNSSGVTYWDSLFQTATGEGISVFVSSGDSGAAGCDNSFSAPPAVPRANSPNAICSSSYATCVGGTEFNDTSNASAYWSTSSNATTLLSAYGYIPEGGWNESTTTSVAGSGGGVSAVITPTPTWQAGTGVPAARAGRYTPDVAFSASSHDGYFACFAAGGGSCVGSTYHFEIFSGTSAAAPGMAGVAALLDQKLGAAQGNLNPGLYTTAASYPAAFHDVTVSTSGAGSCNVNLVTLCDNSIYSNSSGSVQAGYAVGAGYDEVTGLGSLDVATFLNDYTTLTATAPTAATGSASAITYSTASLAGAVNPNGADTHAWFLYGASSTLSGAAQTTSQDIGSGNSATAVSAGLSSLTPGTKYYYEVVAQNSVGTTDGVINSFTTAAAPAPTATTGSASSVTSSTATLAGTANPNDADTHVWFLYGASSTLSGATQTASQDIGSGTATTAVSANLSGLSPSTTYYYEVVAQNSTGTTDGTIGSFTTPAVPVAPAATTVAASSISSTAATLNGAVNPNGADTHIWFLYGASSTLSGATQTTSQDIGSGTTATAVTAGLSSLSPSTTYYFEVVAQNSTGATDGLIQSFTTSATPTFSVSGTTPAAISSPGGTTSSTITLTSENSFSGSIVLSGTIGQYPTGASLAYLPTFSFSPSSTVSLSSGGTQQVTVNINTTAASTAALHRPSLHWYCESGAVLACLLLFGLPARRRRWLSLLGLFALLIVLAGGTSACGGGGGSGSGGTSIVGTTPGTYTFLVTGSSGSTTVISSQITLTVN